MIVRNTFRFFIFKSWRYTRYRGTVWHVGMNQCHILLLGDVFGSRKHSSPTLIRICLYNGYCTYRFSIPQGTRKILRSPHSINETTIRTGKIVYQVGVPGTRKQQTTKRMHKFFSVYYYNSLTVIVQKQLEPPSLLGVTVVKGSLLVY